MGKTSDRFEPDIFQFTNYFVGLYKHQLIGGIPSEILIWRKKGTLCGHVRFIRIGHELFVSGDWRHASYSWSSVETLSWMANTDFQYFHGKCTSSAQGVPAREWDAEYFVRTGAERVKQAVIDRYEEPEDEVTDDHPLVKAWHAINKIGGPHEERVVQSFLEQTVPWVLIQNIPSQYLDGLAPEQHSGDVGRLFFGDAWYEYCPTGWVAAMDCVIHHGTLRMAIAWLKEHNLALWEKVQWELK